MSWTEFMDPLGSERFCLTLLHSLWQVALVAIFAWSVDRLCRHRRVEFRYGLSVAALLAALSAMPFTYLVLGDAEPTAAAAVVRPDSVPPAAPMAVSVASTSVEHSLATADATEQATPLPPLAVQASSHADSSATLTVAPSAEGRSLSWRAVAPWLAASYVAGVAMMLARLVIALINANRLVTQADLVTQGPLVDALHALANTWGMRMLPVLAQSHQVAVPALVGFARPTILLPLAAVNGLSLGQLEMILAHELAHVRRYDMWIGTAQRLAETLLFFNPALWYLSRRANALREYCCDEMACRADSASVPEIRVRYAEALIRVVDLAHPCLASNHNLASLAANGHSPSELRRRLARLLGEPLREPPRLSRGGALMLLLLTVSLTLGLPVWNTLADPPADRAQGEPGENGQREDSPLAFRINIVGPDGTPVANANVEIRSRPLPTADQFTLGEFVRAGSYGAFATADDQGRLALTLPAEPQQFSVSIKQPGFGPYWAQWSNLDHPQEIPDEFTAELDEAWTVGGVVVDDAGQPVSGAEVYTSVDFKKRPGDSDQLGVGMKITTDADGKWQFAHVPVSKGDVHVAINHPGYQPLRRSLPRNGFEVRQDEEPSAQLELDEGLVVAGKVTDESGQPIEGALVRTKFLNDIREAQTDERGFYRLAGCEPGMAQIVVSATGRAVDMQEVRIDPDLEPVDFTMKPGGTVRIRVVDEQGQGIARSRIFFQRWRGAHAYFPFDHVDQYTDENGVWEWNEAPPDEFEADICRADGMQLPSQSLIARDEEFVFSPPKELIVTGRAVDAETGRPIEKFRVTPGLRNSDPGIKIDWITRDSYEASDGTYRVRFTRAHPAHLVQVEAAGYKVAISRDIVANEGEVNIDFALQPAKDISATVLAATGEPAAHAKIALGVAGSQISIDNGDIDDGSTYALRVDADADGRFGIPARSEPFQIVITHPSGFAHLKSADGPIPDPVTLTPWAKVEGTFRVGAQPVANVALSLDGGIHSYGNDVPSIFTHHDVTTGEGGRFVFGRAFPGQGRIGRRITLMVDDGATEVTSSQKVAVELPAGETTVLELGGTGRAVVGMLAPPDGAPEKVLWNFAVINVRANLVPLPKPEVPAEIADDPVKSDLWWETEGRAWKAAYLADAQRRSEASYFTATVARDGSFRIDDMPPGPYVLDVWFSQHRPGALTNYSFSVPPVDEGQTAEPLNLGLLKLEKP